MQKYENNIQEVCGSIKRTSLWIMDIEEGEVQVKSVGNIFKKIIEENQKSWDTDAHLGTVGH
jgi:hypothetical protein